MCLLLQLLLLRLELALLAAPLLRRQNVGERHDRRAALADADAGRIVNIGPMHGGQVTNAVAHHARCCGNVRYRDEATRQDLDRSIRAVVDRLNEEMKAEAEDPPRLVAHTAFIRAAKPSTPEVMALAETARAASEDLGHPMPFAATGGGGPRRGPRIAESDVSGELF